MTKIAIITRTKDRPLFLKRAITDVASQTVKDYIHVIVNDGGNVAEVQAIVDGFDKAITDKIKLFHREQASGAPDTILSESIDRVDSEYIAIHDDDDTWHPEMLERCVQHLDAGENGVVVPIDNIYEKLVGDSFKTVKITRFMPNLRAVNLYMQCLDNQLSTVGFVYRRAAYEAVGRYDDTLPVVGDWEFGLRFLMKYDVAYIDPGFALAYYHRHQIGGTSFTKHDHREYINKVFNKYLRDELSRGVLGVGYIMNDLRYEQDMIAANIRKLLPKSIVRIIRGRIR